MFDMAIEIDKRLAEITDRMKELKMRDRSYKMHLVQQNGNVRNPDTITIVSSDGCMDTKTLDAWVNLPADVLFLQEQLNRMIKLYNQLMTDVNNNEI